MSRLDGRTGPRRGNLALLVRTLREHGTLSRTQLAARSGLARSTVTGLVTDLEGRRLVYDAGASTRAGDRPGQLVALRPDGVLGVGLDVSVGQLGVLVTDLAGRVLHRRRVGCDVPTLESARVLDHLAQLVTDALRAADGAAGPPHGVTVSVPGPVDAATGSVIVAPRLRWRDVAVADGLAARTGLPLDRIHVDNEANLGALVEYHLLSGRGTGAVSDLVYLAGDFGIGGAVISGGRLVRGSTGFAGEIAHMTMDPVGPSCSCGRRGCLETQVGLGALLHACADPGDPVRDPALDLSDRMGIVRGRAERGDRRTLDALHQIGSLLGLGVSILVNVLNPAVVVLGGYFAALAEWLAEPVRTQAVAHTLAPGAGGVEVTGSRQGNAPAAAGAAAASVRRVLDDPTLVPLVAGGAARA